VAATAVAVVLVRFNRKRLGIARAAAAATAEQLEGVCRAVDACGTEPPNGYILARTNDVVDDGESVVHLPRLDGFPWAGRSVAVSVAADVQFRFVDDARGTTRLLGRSYRAVAVPRRRTESGTSRNVFTPSRYLKRSPELRRALETICPAYPAELLSYLLCAGRQSFEFEPIDQARIGATAAWVQDRERHACRVCRKRMKLIVQVPGTLAHRTAFRRATFYFLGCAQHPEETVTVAQFT
jgi:hypothetical protein